MSSSAAQSESGSVEVKVVDTPFGPIRCIVADWLPKDVLLLITPGEKREIDFHEGPLAGQRREFWVREPQYLIVKNIALSANPEPK